MTMNYDEFCEYYKKVSDKNFDELDIIMKVLDYLYDKKHKDKNGKLVETWHKNSAKITEIHEKGPDIVLTGGSTKGMRFIIEAKKKSKGLRDSDGVEVWLTALAQLITRIDTKRVISDGKKNAGKPMNAYKYGLALYWTSARAALNRIPYEIAKILRLHIFSVNSNGDVKEFKPSDFKKDDYKKEDFF